jgi:hypothetical protein
MAGSSPAMTTCINGPTAPDKPSAGHKSALQLRQDVFAEQFDGAHGVGGEAHREHEPLGAGGLGGARLGETILRIAAIESRRER